MPIAFDHILAVVLTVLFPIRSALFGYRRLVLAAPEDVPRTRRWLYRQGIAIQWALVAVALAIWIWQGRPWGSIGLALKLNLWLAGVAGVLAIAIPYVIAQRRRALADDEAVERLRRQLRNIERMMPHDDEDTRWFRWLAITAGICEELLYRGYMIWYLGTWLPPVPAMLIAAVIFGFGHAYQGPRGVILTTFVGVFMTCVYLLTGSIYVGMVIHALMDLHAGHIARAAFAREAAQLAQAATTAPAPTLPPETAAAPPPEPLA